MCTYICVPTLAFFAPFVFIKLRPLKDDARCWSIWRGKSWTNLVLSSLFVQCILWWPQSCRKKMHVVWRQLELLLVQCTRWVALPVLAYNICECDAKCSKVVLNLDRCRFCFAGLQHACIVPKLWHMVGKEIITSALDRRNSCKMVMRSFSFSFAMSA